jgi:hypothetical protein
LASLSEEFETIVEKVKKFIRKLRKSGPDRDFFLELQKLKEVNLR